LVGKYPYVGLEVRILTLTIIREDVYQALL